MQKQTIIEIKDIFKSYGAHVALDNINLSIEEGEIFGLLGPNGAGKTSLIRLITGILGPDQGAIFYKGQKLNSSHISRIGYLPEERGLYKKMGVKEQLVYLAGLKGLAGKSLKTNIDSWLEKFDLASWSKNLVEELSKGMQQKVQFIASVIHQPELLILDEPFTGFDPVNAQLLKEEILGLNKSGTTIVFSTHRMDSVEELCKNIALIDHAKIILNGEVSEIRQRFKQGVFVVEVEGKFVKGDNLYEILSESQEKDRFTVRLTLKDSKASSNDLIASVIKSNKIISFREEIPSVNEIFISQVKKKQR